MNSSNSKEVYRMSYG